MTLVYNIKKNYFFKYSTIIIVGSFIYYNDDIKYNYEKYKYKDKINFLSLNSDSITNSQWRNFCNNKIYKELLYNNDNKLDNYCFYTLANYSWTLDILEKNISKLDNYTWNILCKKKYASKLIDKHFDKLSDSNKLILSKQKWAKPILKKHFNELDFNCQLNYYIY